MRPHKSIFNRLTKKELVHLVEVGSERDALFDFKKLRSSQKASAKKYDGVESCWECSTIAKKLGVD